MGPEQVGSVIRSWPRSNTSNESGEQAHLSSSLSPCSEKLQCVSASFSLHLCCLATYKSLNLLNTHTHTLHLLPASRETFILQLFIIYVCSWPYDQCMCLWMLSVLVFSCCLVFISHSCCLILSADRGTSGTRREWRDQGACQTTVQTTCKGELVHMNTC